MVGYVLFLVSIYGEGDVLDSGVVFVCDLMMWEDFDLFGLWFGMLVFGDVSYV